MPTACRHQEVREEQAVRMSALPPAPTKHLAHSSCSCNKDMSAVSRPRRLAPGKPLPHPRGQPSRSRRLADRRPPASPLLSAPALRLPEAFASGLHCCLDISWSCVLPAPLHGEAAGVGAMEAAGRKATDLWPGTWSWDFGGVLRETLSTALRQHRDRPASPLRTSVLSLTKRG